MLDSPSPSDAFATQAASTLAVAVRSARIPSLKDRISAVHRMKYIVRSAIRDPSSARQKRAQARPSIRGDRHRTSHHGVTSAAFSGHCIPSRHGHHSPSSIGRRPAAPLARDRYLPSRLVAAETCWSRRGRSGQSIDTVFIIKQILIV